MNAYRMIGDNEHALVRRITPPEMRTRDQADELLTELGGHGDFDRTFPGWPTWLEYECLPNDDRRIKFAVADVIASFDRERGAGNLVSESAVEKLAPHLEGEAEFYRAKVRGVPETYYLLWVKRVLDALDYERSVLSPAAYLARDGVVPLRIVRPEFQQDKIRGRLLFRLAPGNLAPISLEDYATEDFLELLKRLKISGAHFYRSDSEKPVVPVKIGSRKG